VFGDPVCPKEEKALLASAFDDFAKGMEKEPIYIAASEQFSQWAMKNICNSLLEVEEELIVDPATYPKKGPNGRLLHKKVNHASRAGVVVKEYTTPDEHIQKSILEVEKKWLKGRHGPQIYMSHIEFFEDNCGKRCFYAVQNDRLVGAIFLNRIEVHQGWLLYLLMATPDAPGGTSEYLVLSTLDKLEEEGCHYFSFGVSAIENIGKIVGLNSFSAWVARIGFKIAKTIFPLDNRRRFWQKFEPHNLRSFTLFRNPSIGFKEIRAIMKTVNASLSSKKNK
jgi:lysylphosphatidylglycerol synthetase-like protein (DUF2156 family)